MNSDSHTWSEALSAQRIFSVIAASSAAGMVVWGAATVTHGILNHQPTFDELDGGVVGTLSWIMMIALTGVGFLMTLRHKLADMVNEVPAYLLTIAVGAAGWWILFRSGATTDVPELLNLEQSILVMGGSALALLVAGLLVDVYPLAKRIWLSAASTGTTVLLGGMMFLFLRPAFVGLSGLVHAPELVGHILAGAAAGFIAVRVGRNLLFGVEDDFLQVSALYLVAGIVMLLSGTVGAAIVRDTRVPLSTVLGFSGAAAFVWLLAAMLRQRPNVFRARD